ncbi:hypothetical protein HK096_007953, partial [Nowakowskiella sp. JEL0078]
ISKTKAQAETFNHATFSIDLSLKPHTTHLESEYCDPENFDSVNLLDALSDDPVFNPDALPSHRLAYSHRRESYNQNHVAPVFISKILPVKPTLNVNINTAILPRSLSSGGSWDPQQPKNGDSKMLLSVSVEIPQNTGDFDYEITSVYVDLTNSIVIDSQSKLEKDAMLPTVLQLYDELDFLFSVTLLDDTPSTSHPAVIAVPPIPKPTGRSDSISPTSVPQIQQGGLEASRSSSIASLAGAGNISTSKLKLDVEPKSGPIRNGRLLCVTVEGMPIVKGLRGQIVVSRWFCKIDNQLLLSNGGGTEMNKTNLSLTHGKIPWGIPNSNSTDNTSRPFSVDVDPLNDSGIYITFSIASYVQLRKIFTLQAFIINKSGRSRNFSIVVPNNQTFKGNQVEKRSYTDIISLRESSNVNQNFSDFLDKSNELENMRASIVCVENNVKLGLLQNNTCQTVNLHFIPIKGHLHTIENIQLYDHDSNIVTDLKNVLIVHVDG